MRRKAMPQVPRRGSEGIVVIPDRSEAGLFGA
jgi:hypothetical protein